MRTELRISSGIAEQFCLFLTGATGKTLSAQRRSKTTFEIMWSAGLAGHRRTDWASSAWKNLFLSLVVLWSLHGAPPHPWKTLRRPKSLWRAAYSVTNGQVLFGATFGDPWCITIAVSTQSVPQATFAPRALTIYLLYQKQHPPTTLDQCAFIKGFRAKRTFFRIKHIRAGAEPLPDDPDNTRDDEIQVSRVPGAPKVGNLPMWVDRERSLMA